MLAISVLLVLPCANAVCAGSSPQLPGEFAYEQAQNARKQARTIISDQATPDDIRKGIELLDQALRVLDQPQNEEISYGNIYLRYRRYDIELDLAAAYARLGEKSAALDHLEAAAHVGVLNGMPTSRSEFKSLASEPRYQHMSEQAAAIDRLWQHPDIATGYSESLTPEQRVAGLSLFWSEANYNFVYFDHIPDLNWDRTYLEFLPQVLEAKTTREYYEVLMRLAPLLRDGHTNIYPPEELKNRFYSRPPLRTELVEGHVLVRDVRNVALEKQGVHVGDEILSVDGQPVREYAEQHVKPYQSSSTPQDTDVRAYTYGLLSGDIDKPVALKLRDARGRESSLNISRALSEDTKRSPKPVFRDLGNGVAYLNVDQFENDATVKAFEAAWSNISKSKGLVLDLRDNGGGSTKYGLRILSYLSLEPIPATLPRERDYTPTHRAQGGGRMDWTALDHAPYKASRKEVFTGPVAVLIGPRTFSAGEDFVASFDMMHRGVLVGEPTGGSTGQPLRFKLPGGGFARICVKRDEYPDGREFVGKGIAPNLVVHETIADVRAGRDPVLARAKTELLKSAH